MLDPRLLRSEPDTVIERQRVRNLTIDGEALAALESRRKSLQQRSEELQATRNARSKAIGQAKGRGEDVAPLLAETASLGAELEEAKGALATLRDELRAFALSMPNLVDDSVPPGRDESDNVEIRKVGTPRAFDFTPKDHVDLGARAAPGGSALDFDAGAAVTGSRFTVMRGDIARLHRALAQLMLDTHTRAHGYTEVNVPVVVNRDALVGTGQLPKFEEDLFRLGWGDEKTAEEAGASDKDYYLVPTSEVPLTNLVRDSILDAGVRCR